MENIAKETKTTVERFHITSDVEYEMNEEGEKFKLTFGVTHHEGLEDIKEAIHEIKVVQDGDVYRPEVNIYKIEDGICRMSLSSKTVDV